MRYNERWEADGVVVTLHDDRSGDEFFALVDETAAARSCDRFDGTDGIESADETIDGLAIDHDCGDEGAVAGVIAFYDEQTGVGVLIEGQRDNLPDLDTDTEMLDAIAESLVWE